MPDRIIVWQGAASGQQHQGCHVSAGMRDLGSRRIGCAISAGRALFWRGCTRRPPRRPHVQLPCVPCAVATFVLGVVVGLSERMLSKRGCAFRRMRALSEAPRGGSRRFLAQLASGAVARLPSLCVGASPWQRGSGCTAVFVSRTPCMRIAGAPLRPMELKECPHEGRLRLVDFGTGEAQHLLHNATGENVALHDRWRLDFAEQMGFLTPLGEPSGRVAVWCNELLALSLHEDPSDDGHLFMLRKGSTEPHLASAFEGRVVVVGFSHRASVGEFTCEVYKHTYPPNELGCLRYWTMPFIQDFVWGSDLHNKFTCRHFPGWEFHLRKLGFGNIAEHMRRSVNSELCAAKKRRSQSPQWLFLRC